jgi:hypothetical protein
MSAVLRSLPLFAPSVVSTMTGIPVSYSVCASVPPDASYRSACLRAQALVLGAYSPCSGIL